MEFRFSGIYHKELDGGYSALCPELDVASQGETIEEAKVNLQEAIELYLESARDLGILNDILTDAGIDPTKDQSGVVTLTGPVDAKIAA